MMRKRKTALFLAGLLALSCLAACSPKTAKQSDSSSISSSPKLEEKDGYWYETLYEGSEEVSLENGKSVEIPFGQEVGEKSYFYMELETDVNLVGYLSYENSEDSTRTNTEKIFIERGSTEFTSFLDSFRIGAFGAFEKKLNTLTLENVEKKTGKVTVKNVSISDRAYEKGEALYINDGHLKMGTSLSVGGAIRHIEKVDANVVEYIDENGDVCIDANVDKETVNVVTDEVNLVNIYDLGREIQQSYYSTVTEANGYAPTADILYDAGLLYNPVQAGSAGDKESQIIDYSVTETELYIKVRPTEWFFDNILSDSYMENTYRLDGKGTLFVTNRFVNFSQFKNMENTTPCGQELPAIYIVHPLNYFYCETIEGTAFDPNLSPLPTTPGKGSVTQEMEGAYHYSLPQEKVKDSWFAFVNKNKFGLGVYMPNADWYNASRGVKTTYYNAIDNSTYNNTIYNLWGMKYFPSAYVANYNYLCPSKILRMVDFIPLQYEYAVSVGTVDELGTTFKGIKDEGKLTNKSLSAWEVV